MLQLIHVTAAYSNAVLVAILPHVSDFAKKLDLPIPQPITASQVAWFKALPYKGEIDGALVLTNHYWFHFSWHGYVSSFRTPSNWFSEQDPAANASRYVGRVNMTTNDAVNLARDTLRKLGYKPELMHAEGIPKKLEGPYDVDKGRLPFCRINWEGPEPKTPIEEKQKDLVQVDIDLNSKSVVGLWVEGTNGWRTPPTVDVEPELEADYQKRLRLHSAKMFTRTNAPPHFVQPKPPASTGN